MPTRERSIRTEAVVLKHSDWGEADRILWLFSRELGKVKAIAKGVRKARSRKAGHLEPFTRVTLMLARGRDLWIITQTETVDAYLQLREDLMQVGYASFVIELLDRFTYEEGENTPLYSLLVDTLHRLDSGDNPALAVRYYEIRLLDHLGYRPLLFECSNCGNEIKPENQFFSPAAGGVLCPACGKGMHGAVPVSMDALRFLRHFQRSGYTEASRAHPSPSIFHEMEVLMQHYLTYILERGLNTPGFIREVRERRAEYEAEDDKEREK